ncbi:MAG TPA: GspE/PulE family protein [Candidatus Magasanikbacteria bacterium]|nr:GspE/PulE family protein [Candidatus Magasanikbacteria bacterium]
MSDRPSINDLIHTSRTTEPPIVGNQQNKGVLTKKMDEIKKKELEVKAMRFAASIGVPHIDLVKFPVTHEALRQISREEVEQTGVVCFFANSDEIRLGALDPTKPEVDEIRTRIETQKHATGAVYVISEVSLERVLSLYDKLPTIKPITKDVEITADALKQVQASVDDFDSVAELLETATTTDVLTISLGAALKVHASDVHVEAEEHTIVVRFRLDGILHDVATLTKDAYKKLLSRIKLLSALKINIISKPQDGRFTIKSPDGDIDVRVSTIPTVFGESIVMRLLVQGDGGITLEELGFTAGVLEKLKMQIERPTGMIITTGPTGSGKSTTLYAILQILNQSGVKIITLEDPVEYRLEGVNQSQIDHTKGYTFATGLRSILRQDPDIVMVGEIRDEETTEIAVQAALTGHLMLSTLHTNSSAGAISRFLSMGAAPYLLAPALNCVMGQRLVRRVCEKCRKKVGFDALEPHIQERVQAVIEGMNVSDREQVNAGLQEFFTAAEKGCSECSGIGYKGRIGICELFIVSDQIKQLILGGQVGEAEIEKVARTEGMRTMVEDGVLKAIEGVTTLNEVFRVIE